MSLLNVTGESSHRELLTANMFESGPMLYMQFYILKIAPAFVFWKNPGHHNLLLRFTDL